MKPHQVILFLLPFLFACEKEPVNTHQTCNVLTKDLDGTYEITITHYPWQRSQEGETFDVLVFAELDQCYSGNDTDSNTIKFSNLFVFYGCSIFKLIDQHQFIVKIDDYQDWAGAPLIGEGVIVSGRFHFEGTVFTSGGQFPIILEGEKASNSRRTDAC